jgi:hypothetical protein
MGDSANVAASASTTSQPSQTNYGGMGMSGLGGLTSAYASYTAGQYNKKVQGQNAWLAQQQADQALQRGAFDANRITGRQRLLQGAQRSAMAGQGVVAGAGTGGAVITSGEAAATSDANMIRLNAIREAYGYQVRSAGAAAAGEMAAREGTMGALANTFNTLSEEQLQADPYFAGMRGRGVSMSTSF